MKLWNLQGGAGRIEMAYHELRHAVADCSATWNDDAFRRFCETYVDSLEVEVRDAIEALGRLDQTLQSADRACGYQ